MERYRPKITTDSAATQTIERRSLFVDVDAYPVWHGDKEWTLENEHVRARVFTKDVTITPKGHYRMLRVLALKKGFIRE